MSFRFQVRRVRGWERADRVKEKINTIENKCFTNFITAA